MYAVLMLNVFWCTAAAALEPTVPAGAGVRLQDTESLFTTPCHCPARNVSRIAALLSSQTSSTAFCLPQTVQRLVSEGPSPHGGYRGYRECENMQGKYACVVVVNNYGEGVHGEIGSEVHRCRRGRTVPPCRNVTAATLVGADL
ncbi:hypothetical protein J6590_070976 [Homalodisca vitripennis]|nr:hypothetical protein J6590_070976 [Homalodisca vitripennis]